MAGHHIFSNWKSRNGEAIMPSRHLILFYISFIVVASCDNDFTGKYLIYWTKCAYDTQNIAIFHVKHIIHYVMSLLCSYSTMDCSAKTSISSLLSPYFCSFDISKITSDYIKEMVHFTARTQFFSFLFVNLTLHKITHTAFFAHITVYINVRYNTNKNVKNHEIVNPTEGLP